ncbi:hypothetical protein [Kitasatospora sp. NPDC057223]|uniref:hypothetical protein n=1 Tax=Kitasatospora sp. NPDC057223 TaxID=3346055 RepID=UPI00363445C8
MKWKVRAAALSLAGVGVAVALSGCSSAEGASGASPELTPPPLGAAVAPPSGRDGMLQLPLSAYGSGDEAQANRLLAVRALITRCMHEAGYSAYTREDAVDEGAAGGRTDNSSALPAGAFGYLPESVAATQGFHGARAAAAPKPRRVLAPAEENASLECGRKAFPQVEDPDQAGAELVGRLFGESTAAVDKDARVVAATKAWGDCMSTAGFAGVTPAGLVDTYRRTAAAAPAPAPEELAAARADAACTGSANLAGIWFDVLAGYQKQQIAANQEKLTTYQAKLKDFSAKIAGIVAES